MHDLGFTVSQPDKVILVIPQAVGVLCRTAFLIFIKRSKVRSDRHRFRRLHPDGRISGRISMTAANPAPSPSRPPSNVLASMPT